MTASMADLYKVLFTGERLRIRFADKRAYESVRTALSKQHRVPKYLLEITDDALCSSFDRAEGIGTFWLGIARKKQRRTEFEILGDTDAEIRSDLEADQGSINGSEPLGNSDSESGADDSDGDKHGAA
jgi:hypothetical protein